MINLIVNGDDFGLSRSISESIVRAHREGVLTSTTALVNGPAFRETVRWLYQTPLLGVGVHLAAISGRPVSDPRAVGSLLSDGECFFRSHQHFLARYLTGRIDLDEIETEFDAQVLAFRKTGLVPDHLDTHQHLHLWPAIFRRVARVARRHGIRWIRNPLDPYLPRRFGYAPLLDPNNLGKAALFSGGPLGFLRARIAARHALRFPDGMTGSYHAGGMDETALLDRIDELPPAGTYEIVVHPGLQDDESVRAYSTEFPGYRWRAEFDGLVSERVRSEIAARDIRLVSYRDLDPEARQRVPQVATERRMVP